MAQEAKKTAQKKAVDPWKAELAERVGRAFKQFNANAPRGSELSQARLGEMVAKRMRLRDPITQAAVSRWMNPSDPSAPDPPTLEALSAILKVDLMWLTYGARED